MQTNGICPYYGKELKTELIACAKCKIKKFCREARDIPLILRPQRCLDDDEYIDRAIQEQEKETQRPDMHAKRFSLADMMHLVRSMAAMDDITLLYLDEVFRNGCGIFFADIARTRKISRQAVHKKIKHEIEKFPELAAVFYPGGRPRWKRNQKTEEAVNE